MEVVQLCATCRLLLAPVARQVDGRPGTSARRALRSPSAQWPEAPIVGSAPFKPGFRRPVLPKGGRKYEAKGEFSDWAGIWLCWRGRDWAV
jgi:hypothetical protein